MRHFSIIKSIWKNRRGNYNQPRFLTFLLTYRCNARCVMCDSWKKEKSPELNTDQISDIVKQLPRMDVVRLSGGEPFLRRDITRIAELIQENLRPALLHITTNALLPLRIVQFCEERKKNTKLHLLVSIDGMKEKHDQQRGVPGAWERGIQTLQALAPRRKELNLDISVNQTIVDDEGVEQYRLLRDYLFPMNIHNNIVLAYDASATYDEKDDERVVSSQIGRFTPFGQFSPRVLRSLFNELEQYIFTYPLAHRIAKRYYLRGARNRLLNRVNDPSPSCVALSSHMRLLPNGDVPTCQFNSKIVGNILRDGFQDVWKSKEAMKMRHWIKRCPGCWAECEVLPSALYTGDIFWRTLFPRAGSHQSTIPAVSNDYSTP